MAKVPEVWLNLPGSLKYQISNYGHFRRKLKSGKFRKIKPYIRKEKWMAVKVDYQGKYQEYYVHHLMGAVFLEEPEDPKCTLLYHKNGFVRDNYAGNIDWIDPVTLGKRTGNTNSKAIPVLQIDPKTDEIINFYKSIGAAARDNYIHKETICMVIRGQLKTAAGYKWRRETLDEAI
jgi:hypothetical protein